MAPLRILFITTSHKLIGDTTEKTGVWLEELADPYFIFKDIGAKLSIASPKGGAVPIDPKSQSIIVATRNTKRFLNDPEAMEFTSNSMMLEEVKADDFDLLFIAGGRGALWDFPGNKTLKQLMESFCRSEKPIGAVSQGVASLISLQTEKGNDLLKGMLVTGISNMEEKSGGDTLVLPFLLEDRLISMGAFYNKGVDFVGYIVADGKIITGQNPDSAAEVARRIVFLGQHRSQKLAHYTPSL